MSARKLDFGTGQARTEICIKATCQIAPMLEMLARASREETEGFEFLVLGTVRRLVDLNTTILQALDDDSLGEADLMDTLYGAGVDA